MFWPVMIVRASVRNAGSVSGNARYM